MSGKSISRVAYVQGDFDLAEVAKLVKAGIRDGAQKVVVVQRNAQGKRIGRFEITPGRTFEYFPETEEGEEFSWKLSRMLREHPIPGFTVLDVD